MCSSTTYVAVSKNVTNRKLTNASRTRQRNLRCQLRDLCRNQ